MPEYDFEHFVVTNHNGDPECFCGYLSPAVTGQWEAFKNVSKHVRENNNGTA